MKEFFGWVRWVWNKQETWQKTFLVAFFFLGAGINASAEAQKYLWSISFVIILFWLTKWCLWDAFWASWAKYKSHRNELLTTIKTSDKE